MTARLSALAWRCLLPALLAHAACAGAVEGMVIDAASGRPIAGAIVTAGNVTAETDDNGRYRLASAAPRLHARAAGYRRAMADAAHSGASTPPIGLTPQRVKAVYLSVYGIGDPGLREAAVRLLGATELNALVIDIKGDRGLVPYPTAVGQAALCGARSVTTVRDMRALVDTLKEKDIYLIARIVAFKDDLLVQAHPEWGVRTASGQLFRDREQLAWIDPFRREAWAYLLDLAEEAAAIGFDEIQFDYVRFPDSGEAQFSQPNTQANRVAAITGFLQAARQRLIPYNIFLAADTFGYTAWNTNDTYIGQDLAALSHVVDYLSPMLYPSGFQFGIPGTPDPLDHSHEIVLRTLQRAIARTGVSPLRFRPWLQAFRDYAFDRRRFDAEEIRAQIDAADKAGASGWMLWNPRNTYTADGLHTR